MPLMNISVQPLNVVSTTQNYALGTIYLESVDGATSTIKNNGERAWRYVKNDEASTAFAAGNLIQRKASTTTQLGVLSLAGTLKGPQGYLGVAQHAIPAGQFGWILTKGWGTVLADATGITADQALIAGNGAAGTFDSSNTATTAGLGWATTAIAGSASGSAYIDIPC